MTNGANYKRGKLHHSPWHSDIRTSNQLNKFLAEVLPRFMYLTFYHRAKNLSKYADGFYHSMIDNKDGHIPLPLIKITCTGLRYALLEWQKIQGVHPKAT